MLVSMSDLLATPGMRLLLTLLVIVQALSLLYMTALFCEFHHIHRKRIAILSALGSERAGIEKRQAKILGSIYVILTLLAAMFSSVLFVWQPHVL